MTVEEAIALHEKYKTAGVVQSIRMDIDELVKFILWQNNEISLLKCCGNCNNYLTICGVGKCFEKTKGQIYRYDPTVPDASGESNCEKWEAKE